MVAPLWQLSVSSEHIRASSQQCARGALSTHGQKSDTESLCEPIKFETLKPYLVHKYQFWTPLTLDFLVCLGLNFHPGWFFCSIFCCYGQKRDYLSRASQRVRGVTKNLINALSNELSIWNTV